MSAVVPIQEKPLMSDQLQPPHHGSIRLYRIASKSSLMELPGGGYKIKRRSRDYRRKIDRQTSCVGLDEPGLTSKSGRVVLIAIGINFLNLVIKIIGWWATASHSMFAECIHSSADTLNQILLAYGIYKSTKTATPAHPYGYLNMKYVCSLISGVGIFCVGTGLSMYHGITGLLEKHELEGLAPALIILLISFITEGVTLIVAIREIQRAAKVHDISFMEYVSSSKDPCVNVVLTEDAAAVASVLIAAVCMALTYYTGYTQFDAVGSLLVGLILGCVASFIIYTNSAALVGKSIPKDRLDQINTELKDDIMIKAIHDVIAIDMGNSLCRYKAEIFFDGRELTRVYLDKIDMDDMLTDVQSLKTKEDLELFMLDHGEGIVNLMGGEIDRIEYKLRTKFPEMRFCDLEIS